MTEEEKQSGVNVEPAAGVQEQATDTELDLESILFGDDEAGVEEEDAADPETAEEDQGEETKETPTEELPTEDASKAFAAKWAAEKDKIREEVKQELQTELSSQAQRNRVPSTPQTQTQFRDLPNEEYERLAEEFETSIPVIRVMYQQQQELNKQKEEAVRQKRVSQDHTLYNDAQKYAQGLTAKNPAMPTWDDRKVMDYRNKHYQQYGSVLPWKEAYRMQVADAVLEGNFTQQAQQDVMQQIKKRDTTSVGLKAPQSSKLTVDDLSNEQFEDMVDRAKSGEFKRS